jgi:hypothetical protein
MIGRVWDGTRGFATGIAILGSLGRVSVAWTFLLSALGFLYRGRRVGLAYRGVYVYVLGHDSGLCQ